MNFRRLLRLDWDAIAGIIAAVAALILHLLHLISVDVLTTIAVVLMALLFIRNLRREHVIDDVRDDLRATAAGVHAVQMALKPQDTVLVGPASIAAESARFSEMARGEMVWFHVCLTMFRPQALFDILLKPALDNQAVESIQFILDPTQMDMWATHTAPKINVHPAAAKVRQPIWVTIDESVSVVVSDAAAPAHTTALLSFWGEPFMARTAGRRVPRYIFLVQQGSELIPRLVDLIRDHRLRGSAT